MDFVQGVSVSGNLRFVMVQRSAVLIDNGGNTFVAGHNALYSIGAFDRLHLCDGFQFRENLRVLLLAYACHGFNAAILEVRFTRFAGSKPLFKNE